MVKETSLLDHSLAADRLLQGFNRGQIAPKCVFSTDYALKPEKRLLAVRGEVNNYAGRLCPVKDYFFMIEIAKAVKEKTEHIKFHLAGEGPERAKR